MRFGLVLGWLAILKKNGLIMRAVFHVFIGKNFSSNLFQAPLPSILVGLSFAVSIALKRRGGTMEATRIQAMVEGNVPNW